MSAPFRLGAGGYLQGRGRDVGRVGHARGLHLHPRTTTRDLYPRRDCYIRSRYRYHRLVPGQSAQGYRQVSAGNGHCRLLLCPYGRGKRGKTHISMRIVGTLEAKVIDMRWRLMDYRVVHTVLTKQIKETVL